MLMDGPEDGQTQLPGHRPRGFSGPMKRAHAACPEDAVDRSASGDSVWARFHVVQFRPEGVFDHTILRTPKGVVEVIP